MLRKWFVGLFLIFLCLSFSNAQNSKKQNETPWEVLQVSAVINCGRDGFKNDCREYSYLTSGILFKGQPSLEWMKESGWELVGVETYEQTPNPDRLYFKRRYDKARTEGEIERLKKEFENSESRTIDAGLKDLDSIENKQKLDEFNKGEELKIKTALQQIKALPLKIIEIKSASTELKKPHVSVEIALDATSVLLKNGNEYRASEAEKYFVTARKQIIDELKLISSTPYGGNAESISKGSFRPAIGNIPNSGIYELFLRISIIVNFQNKQNIVAQGWASGKWVTNPQ